MLTTANSIHIDPDDAQKLEELYEAACVRGTTYDHVVHTYFCQGVRDAYGDDESAAAVRDVFLFARGQYGYTSEDELEALNEENGRLGLCRHGLDPDCCPAGCGDIE